MIQINKYISASGTTHEVGDMYGTGTDEVITTMEEEGKILRIFTSQSYYDHHLQTGDWLQDSNGSSKLVKSKYDKFDE